MLQKQIREWIQSDKDFIVGLKLLEQLDPDSIQLRMMKRSGETQFNQDKLEAILKDHLAPVAHIQGDKQEAIGFPSYDYFSLPEDLQRDHIRKAELYRTAGQLRLKMEDAQTDEMRGQFAELIMQSMHENQRCWERIDYFLQNGSVKKETSYVLPDLEGMDTIQLARFKGNNASNLSKWRKKLAKLTDPLKKAQLLERIHHHEKLQEAVLKFL